MIVKTMQAKARSKFKMPVLRRRAKKMMRTKFKKTIKLSEVDKIWAEWVEHGIVKPLLRSGKVEVDKRFSIEIVGTKVVDDPKNMALLVNGLNIGGKGQLKKAVKFDNRRENIKYKIVLTDTEMPI